MRLGYDAKRAFFNRSGLGNYSRDVLNMLAEYFPMNEYFLYSPQPQKTPLYPQPNQPAADSAPETPAPVVPLLLAVVFPLQTNRKR